MADEERRPLLGGSLGDGPLGNAASRDEAAQAANEGEAADVQLGPSDIIAKLASVVLSFTVTGLAQSAIGVCRSWVACHMLTSAGYDT